MAFVSSGLAAVMREADQHLLRSLLERLRGGLTKVLITSRGQEDWLGKSNCVKIALGCFMKIWLWGWRWSSDFFSYS